MVYIDIRQNLIWLILKTYCNTKGVDLHCHGYKLYDTLPKLFINSYFSLFNDFFMSIKITRKFIVIEI